MLRLYSFFAFAAAALVPIPTHFAPIPEAPVPCTARCKYYIVPQPLFFTNVDETTGQPVIDEASVGIIPLGGPPMHGTCEVNTQTGHCEQHHNCTASYQVRIDGLPAGSLICMCEPEIALGWGPPLNIPALPAGESFVVPPDKYCNDVVIAVFGKPNETRKSMGLGGSQMAPLAPATGLKITDCGQYFQRWVSISKPGANDCETPNRLPLNHLDPATGLPAPAPASKKLRIFIYGYCVDCPTGNIPIQP